WTRSPRTDLLPDRWCAVGLRDGVEVLRAWGAPIPDRMSLGPSPSAAPADGAPGDNDMQWILDFDQALAVGMALRVPLPAGDPGTFDRVLVVGVKASMAGRHAGERLERLLVAHRHTGGLALPAQGSAASEPDDPRRGRVPPDAAFEESFQRERQLERDAPV